MKELASVISFIFCVLQLHAQNEIKFNLGGIDQMIIQRNTNGDLQLAYPNNTNENIFIGSEVGDANKGVGNTGLGALALSMNVNGTSNVGIGNRAGQSTMLGKQNVFLGSQSGQFNTGDDNVFIGHMAGRNNLGSGNIFIGNMAGDTQNGSGTLIIDNGFSNIPFIRGSMDGRSLDIDANLNLTRILTSSDVMIKGASPSLTLNKTGNFEKIWSISMLGNDMKFGFTDFSTLPKTPMILSEDGDLTLDGEFNNKQKVTINMSSTSNTSVLRFDQGGLLKDYELIGGTSSLTIRGGEDGTGSDLPIRMTFLNDRRLLILDEVEIRNDMKVTDAFESRILLERSNTGAHDWELLSKNGDFFIRGGADGSGNDLDNKLTIRNDGDLEVCGKISATSATVNTISCSSDARFKENILPLDNALSQLLLLNGVSYDWRRDQFPNKNFTEQRQMGFLAQEVEKIFPDLVETDEDGYKSIDYIKLTPLLVESIKEQQKAIEEMKLMLDTLTKKFEEHDEKMQAQSNIDPKK